ncbi:MAG: hypothetical protein IKK79_03910 [Spirochaetaceae bacterium]|nr:hypothetical protein [Spirochaetaceae bacterium]
MKKTRIVLVGALVLALAFVMGCKQVESSSEGVSDIEDGKQWEITNDSKDNYRRWISTYPNANQKWESATFKLRMERPQDGKAGIIFGLTESSTGNIKTYNFYVFGIGQNINTGKPEYYVTYYSGVKPEALTDGTSPSTAPSESSQDITQGSNGLVTIENQNFVFTKDKPLEVYVKLEWDKTDKTGYKLSFGSTESTIGLISVTGESNGYFSASNYAASKLSGSTGFYGMVSKATDAGTKSAKNQYQMIQKNATILAAEEE